MIPVAILPMCERNVQTNAATDRSPEATAKGGYRPLQYRREPSRPQSYNVRFGEPVAQSCCRPFRIVAVYVAPGPFRVRGWESVSVSVAIESAKAIDFLGAQ